MPTRCACLLSLLHRCSWTHANRKFLDLLFQQDEPPIVAPEVAELSQAGQGAAAAQLAATLRSASLAQQAGSAAGEASLGSQPKHVFVFSTAGKPIYAYHRDEAAQAGLCATAEAILSVAHSKGHTLRHVRWGYGRGVRGRQSAAWMTTGPSSPRTLFSNSLLQGGSPRVCIPGAPSAVPGGRVGAGGAACGAAHAGGSDWWAAAGQLA